MDYKKIDVREETRFVICIDETFENVYMKDLSNIDSRLTAAESAEILKNNIDIIKILTYEIEDKKIENEIILNKEKLFKNLKVVK